MTFVMPSQKRLTIFLALSTSEPINIVRAVPIVS
jgi:hypothetical protein